MNRKSQIALGIAHLLVFAAIITAEILDPREFGLSKGEVIEKVDNHITCFGEELQYDAEVVLDLYKELHIPIKTTYLSDRLAKGEHALFIYWGTKRDIESPIPSFKDTEYYTGVKIALVSIDSWVTWYYALFQAIKWLSLVTGVLLLVPTRIWKRRTI